MEKTRCLNSQEVFPPRISGKKYVYDRNDEIFADEAYEIVNVNTGLHLIAENRNSNKAKDYVVVYISKSYVFILDTSNTDDKPDECLITLTYDEFNKRYSNGLHFQPYIRSLKPQE